MYAKLAWRNISRSLRDYSIYFLTLVLAVAIFYVFNSISDQPAYLQMRESTRRMAQGSVEAISWLTIIMTGVVALLVLYANRAIIKKRSRELGTYLLLGMEQGRLAFLLLAETTLIGLAALLVGLGGGILLSQVFSLVVSRVFAVDLVRYTFVFSPTAALRTLLCYGVTFLLVGLWQAVMLYRHKLIDLMNGARKNEEVHLRNGILSGVLGAVGVAVIGYVYWLADQVSRDAEYFSVEDPRIWAGVALAVAATYLLFLAAAGLLTRLRGTQSGWMGRGLNRFIYRQVTNKINTHAAMLATIALMLTFTICAMSFGLGLGQGVQRAAELEMPFDYILSTSSVDQDFHRVLERFDEYGITNRQAVQFLAVSTVLENNDLMLPADEAALPDDGYSEFLRSAHPMVIPASAYAELRAMKGYPAAVLSDNGFLIHTAPITSETHRQMQTAFQRFMESGAQVELAGRTLRPSTAEVYTEPMSDSLTGSFALLVVPDEVAASLEQQADYVENDLVVEVSDSVPEELDREIQEIAAENSRSEEWISVAVRAEIVGAAYATEGTIVFLAFYMGVMFVLVSAALLSLQQVTDAVEHRQRFEVLRKLGADERMIDRAIAKQIAIYFLTPMAVALAHSLVAMRALAQLLQEAAGFFTVWSATVTTLVIFGLIYGAYYLLSLQNCRRLFKEPQVG